MASGGGLTAEQQHSLNEKKVSIRLNNERYLRDHPELRTMTSKFMASVLEAKPDDVVQFAAKFFTERQYEE